jgi:antitoxin MazE
MKSQIGQWGNSLAFRIPKYVAESLNLQPNDTVECLVEDGKMILRPIRALPLPEFTLEELLAEVTEPPEGEVDWGTPQGEEVW